MSIKKYKVKSIAITGKGGRSYKNGAVVKESQLNPESIEFLTKKDKNGLSHIEEIKQEPKTEQKPEPETKQEPKKSADKK